MLINLALKAQMALLLIKNFSICKTYTNFSNIFSKQFAAVLLKCLDINEHAINLEPSKQLLYKLIYSWVQ